MNRYTVFRFPFYEEKETKIIAPFELRACLHSQRLIAFSLKTDINGGVKPPTFYFRYIYNPAF